MRTPSKNTHDYYVEPVEIEIYLKKAGKVRTIIKDMAIELIEVTPPNEKSEEIFTYFRENDEPVDLMEVQNNYPEFIKIIYDSYYQNMELFERVSMLYKEGLEGSTDAWRLSLYYTELLMKYEPTVASSQYIGDFQTHNLNYIIRTLNKSGQKYLLEDSTVWYLIKRRNAAYRDSPPDHTFNKLVELWEYNLKEKDHR